MSCLCRDFPQAGARLRHSQHLATTNVAFESWRGPLDIAPHSASHRATLHQGHGGCFSSNLPHLLCWAPPQIET
eukprot:5482187-Amphidinium_carterae.1